jgi:putative NADH-flavin reductase
MRVIIFGSTGRTGKYLIQFALEEGHEVTAFARIPDAISIHHPRLKVFQGDATREQDVDAAFAAGQDAVLFAVGTDLGQTNLRQTAMKNIIAAMQKHHVKRLVGVGGMGILQASEDHMIFEGPDFPKEYVPVSQDHYAAWQALLRSGLDFSFICPPNIPDGPFTGKYIVQETFPPDGKFLIDTADLAHFMVKELSESKFSGKRVGITAV